MSNDAVLFLYECISSGCDIALVGESNRGQFSAVKAAAKMAGIICFGHTSCDLENEESLDELVEFLESGSVEMLREVGGVLFIDNTVGMRGKTVRPLPARAEEALRDLASKPGRASQFVIVVNTAPDVVTQENRLGWLSKVSW